MELLLVFIAGFFVGEMYGYYRVVKAIRRLAEDNGFDIEKELGLNQKEESKETTSVYKLNVEQHGDMLYLFDSEKDNFICQGSSVQELCKLAKEQKNVKFAAVKHGDKIFAFKDGVSIEVLA